MSPLIFPSSIIILYYLNTIKLNSKWKRETLTSFTGINLTEVMSPRPVIGRQRWSSLHLLKQLKSPSNLKSQYIHHSLLSSISPIPLVEHNLTHNHMPWDIYWMEGCGNILRWIHGVEAYKGIILESICSLSLFCTNNINSTLGAATRWMQKTYS